MAVVHALDYARLPEAEVVARARTGDHEAFRPFRDRDRIDFAGRTGFIRLALRAQVPIVPAVSCGATSAFITVFTAE